MNPADVAKLVQALDHPDGARQREVMARLVDLGPEALDPLAASLHVSNSRVRTCLVQVLGELGDPRALLPLMRFVFDTRDDLGESNARALAMKSIVALAGPEHARRLFNFLLDVYDDDDPFVRGYAFEAMGRFGDRRARPILEEALRDPEDFVRERAERALEALEEGATDALSQEELDDEALLGRIRGAQGGERSFFVEELMGRENAFELATRLVRERTRGATLGLKALLELDDPRARPVALRHFESTADDDHRAICLRILGAHIRGDATEAEREAIRVSLYHADPFVVRAALQCAGASGDTELIRRAITATRGEDAAAAASAARGLSRGLSPEQRRFLPDLQDAFRLVHAKRLQRPDEDRVRAEAYLVRAMAHLVSGGGFGTTRTQELALRALQDSEELRPILITALQLLHETTPAEGYDEDRRWSAALVRHLVTLASHPDDEIRGRVLDLLVRGAPAEMEELVGPLSKLLYDRSADIVDVVIPLLARTRSDRAVRLLHDLADEPDEEVRLAAEAAIRRIRNSEDFIDAEFEPKD